MRSLRPTRKSWNLVVSVGAVGPLRDHGEAVVEMAEHADVRGEPRGHERRRVGLEGDDRLRASRRANSRRSPRRTCSGSSSRLRNSAPAPTNTSSADLAEPVSASGSGASVTTRFLLGGRRWGLTLTARRLAPGARVRRPAGGSLGLLLGLFFFSSLRVGLLFRLRSLLAGALGRGVLWCLAGFFFFLASAEPANANTNAATTSSSPRRRPPIISEAPGDPPEFRCRSFCTEIRHTASAALREVDFIDENSGRG